MMPLQHGPHESAADSAEELARRAYQPDIYQRYSFLRGLTHGLLRGGDHVTALDVGCGPVRLTETFLGPAFAVTRADIEGFDASDIQLLVPGEPLPFDSATFDLVLGLEVIEHLPQSARSPFVRELERVSRGATIVSCPVATPETIAAERRFSEWAIAISGRDVDFLAEHRDFGLPAASDVVSWFASPGDLIVAENAPLDDWLAFNLLDLIYAADFGDTAEKQRFAAAINARAPLCRVGEAHYRRFFCAIRDSASAEVARQFVRESSSRKIGAATGPLHEVLSAVIDLRAAMRLRLDADLAAKDTSIAQFISQVEELTGQVEELTGQVEELARSTGVLQATLTDREAQLESQGAASVQLRTEVERLEALVASVQAELHSTVALLAQTTSELGEREAEITRLLAQIARLEESGASLRSSLVDREAELAAARASLHAKEIQLDEAQHRLESVLSSRSWRAMAPARFVGRSVRRGAEVFRRVARASSPLPPGAKTK